MDDPSSACVQAERRAEVAAFIVALFQAYFARLTADGDLGPPEGLPQGPAHVSDDLQADCHAVARVLAQARNNPREYIACQSIRC